MSSRPSLLRPLALAALIAATSAAQAALTAYTDRASFLAAAGATGTDSFDDLSPGSALVAGAQWRHAGAFDYTVSSAPNSDVLFGAGSEADAWLSTRSARDTITFDGFAAGTRAAGASFFGTDFDGQFVQRGLVVVTATDADGGLAQFRLRARQDTFFGFVSDTGLQSLTVRVLSSGRNVVWPTVDDFTLAAAVPEPGTTALLLAGLGVLGGAARRRA